VLFPTPTSTSRFLTSKSRSPGAARITTGQRFGDGGDLKRRRKMRQNVKNKGIKRTIKKKTNFEWV
jgi:hypothetical protein